MDTTPRWIPIRFGTVMLFMGAMVLGAQWGVVPTDVGRFLAPAGVITSLGLALSIGGFLLWIPPRWPAFLRGWLFTAALVPLLIVCNWTAFAPDVSYSSSTSLGPMTFEGQEQVVGGRIVFGVAAIVIDALALLFVVRWIRSGRSPEGD